MLICSNSIDLMRVMRIYYSIKWFVCSGVYAQQNTFGSRSLNSFISATAILNPRRCARHQVDKKHHRIILSFDFMSKMSIEAISRYRLSREIIIGCVYN